MQIRGLIATAFSATVLVSGCATAPQDNQRTAELQRTIPTCEGVDDCNAKWESAQLWVVRNAGFKIQTQSNVLIETYNATGGTTDLAVRVMKEPQGKGKYRLLVDVWCDNMFGCIPNAMDTALRFNREIGAIKP